MKNFKSLVCALTLSILCTINAKAQNVNNVGIGDEGVKTPIKKETKPAVKAGPVIRDITFTPVVSKKMEAPIPNYTRTLNMMEKITSRSSLTTIPELIESASKVQFKYAMMMDVAVESIKMTGVYKFIDNWYGTRYRYGGTTKKGIDCSAFTGQLMSNCYSLSLPRTAREQHRITIPVKKEELSEGDLVFFNTTGGVSHVGVYLSNGYFVHSSSSEGVRISNLNEAYYAKRFLRGGRIVKDDCNM